MNLSIDTIIKQAMAEAGFKPAPEKKSSENRLANELYDLANALEKLGNVTPDVVKAANSNQGHLRELGRAYLFQQMLKSAVESRFGIKEEKELMKSAGETNFRAEYLKAFEKKAGEGLSRWVLPTFTGGLGALGALGALALQKKLSEKKLSETKGAKT